METVIKKEDIEFTEAELLGSNFGWEIGGFLRRPSGTILIHFFETERGYQTRPCGDCNGTGRFIMPDNSRVKCNVCKGRRRIYLNV